MKRLYPILLTLCAFLTIWSSCSKEDDTPAQGSIYGVITDKATGEPLKSAGVELLPLGLKTVTGSEGQFEFVNLDEGSYNLLASKTGYADNKSNTITVKDGQSSKCDFQLELLPPALKVVDDSRHDITELVFDNSESDVSRSFNIFNDGAEKLEWEISASADWIKSFSKEKGTLAAGGMQSIILTIDREKLKGGEEVTTIHVTSNNGSKQITVKVSSDEKTLAKLNTLAVGDIHLTTAVFNGEIIDTGSPSYTERGFVYATSSMPTVDNTIKKLTVAVTSEKEYSYKATGLEEGKTYYVRAYAINKTGTAYSTNEVSFQPKKSLPEVKTEAAKNKSISEGRITLNGNVTNAGEPEFTEKGFVYGTSHNPTIEDDTKKTVPGSGTGVFSANITNLSVGKVYYARAYAKNSYGTAYGSEISLDFNAILPTLKTEAATDVLSSSATLNGTILTTGEPAYTERGFVYSTNHNPSVENDTKKTVAGSGTGAFSAKLTNMAYGTYYVRAYAKTSYGTAYGLEKQVEFKAVIPTVRTDAVSDITATSATLNGTVLTVGDPAYTERGFIYGTTPAPTLNVSGIQKVTVTGITTGSFSAKITGFEEGTTYYVRAFAKTSTNVAYGETVSFKYVDSGYVVFESDGIMVQKKDLGSMDHSKANSACYNSRLGGYSDWRLPTLAELIRIYEHYRAGEISGFSGKYWAYDYHSSKSGTNWQGNYVTYYYYCFVDFSTGKNTEGYLDTEPLKVRAVRTIR